jgi:hypothetical protein
MKLVRRKAKYIWQEYKTYEFIILETKINPVVKKIKKY